MDIIHASADPATAGPEFAAQCPRMRSQGFCPFPLCETSEKSPLLQIRLLAIDASVEACLYYTLTRDVLKPTCNFRAIGISVYIYVSFIGRPGDRRTRVCCTVPADAISGR